MSKIQVNIKDYNLNNDKCILLGRIIQKAKKNGYIHKYKFSVGFMIACNNAEIYKMIFSHDFTKAFWGEFSGYGKPFGEGEAPDGFTDSGFPKCKRDWRFHIQKMALEKEPLKYLEKFL